MMSKIKIAAVDLNIVWGDPETNLNHVEKIISRLPADTDIVVLPELFSTGFMDDPDVLEELSQTNGGDTIHRITAMARRYNMAIAGSFAARTGHHYFNRGFFIEPSGEETFYDKKHLFGPSVEAKNFTPGTGHIPVVRYRGWNISLVVCYDLRFPVWMRNRHNAYDLLIIPANWPHARAYAWEHLLIARAIENQSVVVGCNRSGSDAFGTYDALTYIFDALGQPVGHRLEGLPVVYAEVDISDIARARRKLPVADDADEFTL